MMHGWYGGGWEGGLHAMAFPWGGLLVWLVLLVVVGLAVALILMSTRNRAGSGRELKDRWIGILTERYVKGEIDAEKFKAMKAELEEMGKKKG